MDYCLLIPSQSRVLCRGEQLLLTFSDEGSSQLKLFSASLTLQGPECTDPTLSVIGQHYGYCRILFEVTIAGCRFVYSEIEDSVNSHKVRRGEVRSAVRSHGSCKS